jgi:predicted nucleic acid-binding protein
MMISDSLQVALIFETLEAKSPQRRRAARILLELSRAGQVPDLADGRVRAACEAAGTAVATEASSLLEQFGLAGPAHGGSKH